MIEILQILCLPEITFSHHWFEHLGTQYPKDGVFDYQEYFDSEITLPIRFWCDIILCLPPPETVMHLFSDQILAVFVGPTSPAIGAVVKASDYVMSSQWKIYNTNDWLLQLLCTKYGETVFTKWQNLYSSWGGVCANQIYFNIFQVSGLFIIVWVWMYVWITIILSLN